MTLNRTQTNKIGKMKNYIEEIFDSGKLPKGATVYDIREAYTDLQQVYERGYCTTISEEVKKLFDKFKFKTVIEGIGWNITV